MDPARISSSLNAAKTRRASEEKRSCGPGCIAHVSFAAKPEASLRRSINPLPKQAERLDQPQRAM